MVSRLRWTGYAGAALAIVLAMPPASAVAATVSLDPDSGVITYEGFGEANDLSISGGGATFSFQDEGQAPIIPVSPMPARGGYVRSSSAPPPESCGLPSLCETGSTA